MHTLVARPQLIEKAMYSDRSELCNLIPAELSDAGTIRRLLDQSRTVGLFQHTTNAKLERSVASYWSSTAHSGTVEYPKTHRQAYRGPRTYTSRMECYMYALEEWKCPQVHSDAHVHPCGLVGTFCPVAWSSRPLPFLTAVVLEGMRGIDYCCCDY